MTECHIKYHHMKVCVFVSLTHWQELTHWGRVTHICVSKLTIIGSDNGLSPDRRQAIIWTNAGLLLIGPLRYVHTCAGGRGRRMAENWLQHKQAEPWWRASIWRSHRKVVIKQCSYHNNIIDIQNRLPYSKVVYPAIIVLFSCLMEVNHGVRTGPDYPFR